MAKRTTTPKKAGPHTRPWLAIPAPITRRLQVYAVDPSAGDYVDNRAAVEVPWEPLARGPVGAKVAVIDYDPVNKRYYPPVHLDDPSLIARGGLDPSESDPRFHQQMVYAVACKTIEMFEVALGRPIHWRRAERVTGEPDDGHWRKTEDIWVLNLYPHAMQQANAYYSPQAHGILFGYFTANETGQGRNLPGQTVFTCLSQDIIAHEVTHAVVDGIRTYFTEPTNPDVLAFHEGFADLCALFAHFSQKAALLDTIKRTGGRIYAPQLDAAAAGPGGGAATISAQLQQANPFVQLAQQFGEARGTGRALRSALGTPPNSDDIHTRVNDAHFRGSILVAAVFDAYFTVYIGRTEDLFRIYRAGGGGSLQDLPEALAERLAAQAAESATHFFGLCARALDYCPPVDVTFGDFLRALITVATELSPSDPHGVCNALMQAFRLRGIYPVSASFFSLDALRWPAVYDGELPPLPSGLAFGGPDGLTHAEKDINGDLLRAYATANREALGLDPDLPVSVPSFHTMYRPLESGRVALEMVVEVVQTRATPFDAGIPQAGSFPHRGGATLIIAAPTLTSGPVVRFVIGKSLLGEAGAQREANQRAYALANGLALGDTDDSSHFQASFGALHEER